MIHNTGNAPTLAYEVTAELFQISDRLADPALRMEAHHAAWACAHTLGDNVAMIEHMRHGLAIYESEKHGAHAFSYGGHDTAVCGKAIGGISLWLLGYPDQATSSVAAAIALAESMGHAPSLAHALLFAAQCHKHRRDVCTVFSITDRLTTLAHEHQLMLYHAIGGVIQGWALAQQGQIDAGLAKMRHHLESYDTISRRHSQCPAELLSPRSILWRVNTRRLWMQSRARCARASNVALGLGWRVPSASRVRSWF